MDQPMGEGEEGTAEVFLSKEELGNAIEYWVAYFLQ